MAVVYISWAPHCSRSDYTARELQGVSHMVYLGSLGSRWSTVWLKYLGQTVRTWRILLKDKPDAVFVMSPPVIAGLVVYPYCWLRGIPFVVDAHTGAFLDPRWRHFQGLQRWLCRRAATTIVTNTYLADMLAAHGADTTILPDVPVKYPAATAPSLKAGFSVAVICSFDYDEPVDAILETARLLPDVQFRMTGNPKKLLPRVLTLPPNLQLTGFLDNTSYGQLLRESDVVMALTTGQHKMLRAAYEAIYQGTPIIISSSPMLREEFGQGGVIVENSAEVIAAAVKTLQADPEKYRREAGELRAWKERRWERNRAVLMAKIGQEAAVDSVG